MKNVIVIIKNAWGESPPPKVKTGFIPNLCDWEKKNYLTNPGSYYRQKASVGYIAMKGWLFTICVCRTVPLLTKCFPTSLFHSLS